MSKKQLDYRSLKLQEWGLGMEIDVWSSIYLYMVTKIMESLMYHGRWAEKRTPTCISLNTQDGDQQPELEEENSDWCLKNQGKRVFQEGNGCQGWVLLRGPAKHGLKRLVEFNIVHLISCFYKNSFDGMQANWSGLRNERGEANCFKKFVLYGERRG